MDTDFRYSLQVFQNAKRTASIDSGGGPITFVLNVATTGSERTLKTSLKNTETGQRTVLFESCVPASADFLAGQEFIHSQFLAGVADGYYMLNVEDDGQRIGHMPVLVRNQRRPDCGN